MDGYMDARGHGARGDARLRGCKGAWMQEGMHGCKGACCTVHGAWVHGAGCNATNGARNERMLNVLPKTPNVKLLLWGTCLFGVHALVSGMLCLFFRNKFETTLQKLAHRNINTAKVCQHEQSHNKTLPKPTNITQNRCCCFPNVHQWTPNRFPKRPKIPKPNISGRFMNMTW